MPSKRRRPARPAPKGQPRPAPKRPPRPRRTKPPKGTYRDAWVEALDGLLLYAEDLKARTEAAYSATEQGTLVRSAILIGLRGRRLLLGARVLAEREWDDLVANLARALVDAAIEAEYLHVTSTFGKGDKHRTHTPEDKAKLFETQRFLLLDLKTEELSEEQKKNQEFAIQFRLSLGVRIGHNWHGRTTANLLSDLKRSADDVTLKGLEAIGQAFRIASFFEHNNANPGFYIKGTPKAEVKVLDTCRHSWPVQTAAQSGAIVLNRWGEALGMSEEERIDRLRPVLRLTGVDPMSYSADS